MYTAVVTNHGSRPAAAVTLVDTLPSQVSYVSDDAACHPSGATVTCGVGDLVAGGTRTATITAHVPADLVYDAGGPVTLTNRTTVDNLAAPDPVADNDSATTSTRVVAVADLAVTSFSVTAPPTQVLIGQTLDVTLNTAVASNGPSSPMDAVVVTAATAGAGPEHLTACLVDLTPCGHAHRRPPIGKLSPYRRGETRWGGRARPRQGAQGSRTASISGSSSSASMRAAGPDTFVAHRS
ncbi:hypothetical protein [Streptomyces sp. NBC_00272]|uniref:hypothetical protein n=1 Tax=Streptomyces sp. NBC_00272 TaxID=2975698 RepID=UPI003FA7B78B